MKHTSKLLASNGDLLESGKYSDLILRSGAREWHVHRSLLCPRSKFFAAACDGQFQEASTRLINLEEDSPAVIDRLLRYLYTLDYIDVEGLREVIANTAEQPSSISSYPTWESEDETLTENASKTRHTKQADEEVSKLKESIHDALMINTRVYVAADKYDIPELKELAHEKILSRLCLQPWPFHEFDTIVLEVVQSTPTTDTYLRKTVLNICASTVEQITGVTNNSDNTISAEDWEPVLKEDPDFLLEILKRSTGANVRKAKKTEEEHEKDVIRLEQCQARLDRERERHELTQAELDRERKRHELTQAELDRERKQHELSQFEIFLEREQHELNLGAQEERHQEEISRLSAELKSLKAQIGESASPQRQTPITRSFAFGPGRFRPASSSME